MKYQPTEEDCKQAKAQIDYFFKNKKRFEQNQLANRRSLDQNKYMWACFTIFGADAGYTKDEVYQVVQKHGRFKKYFEYEKEGFKFHKGSSKLDTKKFALFLDDFRIWCMSEHGCNIPTPEEYHGKYDYYDNFVEKIDLIVENIIES